MQETRIPSTVKMASALNQQRLSIALKFSVITAAVVALYLQDLTMVFTGALTNETTYHVLAIPFLFAYLIYRKRKMTIATLQPTKTGTNLFQKYFSTLAGISLSAVAILTYWFGSYTFTPIEYHMLTLPFLTAGLILILFNTQTLKQLLFPIAFLIFLAPPPDEILYGIGSNLANLSASASNALSNLFGLHAVLSTSSGSPIITLIKPNQTTLNFGVDVACSGIYSLIGFVIFALFIAYIMRGKLRNKFAILIMGIPLIVALNIIRITAILAIGYNFGQDLGLQLFHDVGAIVLMFIGVLVLLAITDKAFKKPKPPQPCPICNPTPAKPAETFCPNCGKLFKLPKIKLTRADIAKIVGIAIIVVMLLSIQAPVFALTQGPAQVIYQTPSGTQVNTNTQNFLLPNMPGYTLSYVYRDTTFEQESGDDAALVYSYNSPNDTTLTVWVALQIAPSVTSEHQWETCLINYPLSQGDTATVNQLDLRDMQIQDNPPMTASYFAFQYKDTNATQVVLYWYEIATFDTNGTAETKSAMISIVMYPSSPQNLMGAEAQELRFANAIINYWAPIQTWSPIALAISQNGLALSAIAAAILFLLMIYGLYLDRKEKCALLNLYQKLPPQDQLMIKAVTNAKKNHNPTTQFITLEFQKLSKTSASETWIAQKLSETEDVGLISKTLTNKDDTPTLAWKSQIQAR
ncbi:MAG: exosortase/archaeosortase family protein [Candidatus Bathyarchaeia archaeon]|jgi:exosortase